MPTPFDELSSRSYLKQPIAGAQVTSFGDLSKLAPPVAKQPEQSLFDVTLGAAEFGAADIGANLGGYIGSYIPGDDYFDQMSKSLRGFMNEHPEYAPTEVTGVLDLMSNPKALVSRTFAAVPYLLATMGVAALPIPGSTALAAGMIYGIEQRRAYESAIRDGASEDEANTSGEISGVVNSALQILPLGNLMKFVKGGKGALASEVIGETTRLAKAVNASAESARFLAVQTLAGVLQGGANELIPLGVYGKEIDKGFIDRRLQDAVGATVTSAVFGLAGRQFNSLRSGPPVEGGTATSTAETPPPVTVDAYSRNSLEKVMLAKGLDPKFASASANLTDARASLWSSRTGLPKEQYYATHGVDTGTETPVGNTEQAKGVSQGQGGAEKVDVQGSQSEKAVKSAEDLVGLFEAGGTEKAKVAVSEDVPVVAVEDGKMTEAELLSKKHAKSEIQQMSKADELVNQLFETFKTDLTPEDNTTLEKVYGKKDTENKVAVAFRKYLATGQAPSTDLIPTFDAFKEWARDIYGSVAAVGKVKLPEATRAIFDRLFYEDVPVVSQARKTVEQAELRVAQLRTMSKVEGIQAENSGPIKQNLTDARTELSEAKRQLQRVKEAQFDGLAKSQGQLLDENQGQLVSKYEDTVTRTNRTRLERAQDKLSQVISMAAPLKRFLSGQRLVEGYDNARSRANQWVGKYEDVIHDTYKALTTGETKWLMKTDENGETNLQRAFDSTSRNKIDPSQLSQNIQEYGNLLKRINSELGSAASAAGVLQTRTDGSAVLFDQPEGQRVPRILQEDARTAIINKSGPLWDALVDYVMEHNPGLETYDKATRALDNDYGNPSEKKSGSLEYARKIVHMPAVLDVGGKDIGILHTEPLEIAQRSVRNQAFRLERIKEFGQGMLEKIDEPKIKRLAKILGIDTSVSSEFLKGVISDHMLAEPEQLVNMSRKQLLEYAKNIEGLKLGFSKQDLINDIYNVSPKDLGKRGVRKLQEFARDIKGIDPDQPPIELLKNVKQALLREPDDLHTRLTEKFVAEGGDKRQLDDFITVAEGLPYKHLERTPLNRGIKLASSVIAAMQTSLAVIPNLTQTIVQVPQLAGMKNFLSAVDHVFRDRMNTEAQVRAFTGIPREKLITQAEPGYGLEWLGKTLQTVVAKGSMQEWISQRNNLIAGESFKLLADQWKTHGLTGGDFEVARSLGLTEGEVNSLRTNPDKMSNELYAKVVQAGIAKTQFMTEHPHNKGKYENTPIGRMLFAYSSYAMGTTRANVNLVEDIKSALTKKDAGLAVDVSKRLSLLLVGAVGAGMTASLLREAVKGRSSSQQDETFFAKALGAINDTAMFGMVNRIADAVKYDQGMTVKTIAGMMPQLSVVIDTLDALRGVGKWGEFPVQERAGEQLKRTTPVAGAVDRWYEKIAYPGLANYEEAKAASNHYMDNLKTNKNTGPTDPVNADYYNVFERVKRFDLEAAGEEARSYIVKSIKDGKDVQRTVEGLRSSLTSRSPIPLGDINFIKFIVTLPIEERQKFLRTHLDYMNIVNVVAPRLAS